MLYFPERMAKGDVPNVDFLHLYGPGSLHVLVGWYELFGNTLAAERTFGLLQHVAIILGLFTLARPWGRVAATLVGGFAVFYVLTPIGLTAMAWNGGLALTLWCAVFAVRSTYLGGRPPAGRPARRRRARRAGADVPPRPRPRRRPLVLGWLVWTQRPSWRAAAVGVARRADAAVGTTSPSPGRARRGRAWSSTRSSTCAPGGSCPGRRRGTASTARCRRSPRSQPPWWRPPPPVGASQALFLWFLAMLAGTVGAARARRLANAAGDAATAGPTVLLVVALVSVGILPQALQRPDSTHLTWVTCVSWPFAVVAVADVVQRRWPRDRRCAGPSAAGAAFTLVLTFVVTSLFTFRHYLLHTRVGFGRVPSTFEVSRDDRNFYFGARVPPSPASRSIDDLDGLGRARRPAVRRADGPVAARGTATPSSTGCSRRWSRRRTSSRWTPASPTPRAPASPTTSPAPTSSSSPSFWDGWREPNASMEFGSPAPNEVLADHFCQYRAYEDGLVRLYYRCR